MKIVCVFIPKKAGSNVSVKLMDELLVKEEKNSKFYLWPSSIRIFLLLLSRERKKISSKTRKKENLFPAIKILTRNAQKYIVNVKRRKENCYNQMTFQLER
jgi:hypothetical protein